MESYDFGDLAQGYQSTHEGLDGLDAWLTSELDDPERREFDTWAELEEFIARRKAIWERLQNTARA